MSNQFRRSLAVDVRVLSEKDGTVEYIASDATLDSYNESILPSGWRFSLFEKNSPFVDSHNYWSIESLLGKVESARIEGGQLVERVRWAKDIPEAKLAVMGWKMTTGGFLKAVSVGFRSMKSVSPGSEGWNGAVKESGLSPDAAAKCRRIFIQQEQLELSACVIGANPSAVAKAWQEGCLKDADLAGVGFTDDDMHFLKVSGQALESGDLPEWQRQLIGREMGRINARLTPSRKSNDPKNSPPSGKPGGDGEARRQADRKDFLRQLEALVSK